MTTPIAQIPKPDAEQYKDRRKLFLVPTFLLSRDASEDGQQLLEHYWSEVRDHFDKLQRSLGKVAHVYHEAVFSDGEEGMRMLEELNSKGASFIQALCHSDAKLEATEDMALAQESSDWQRCLSVGLVSEKVVSAAVEGYQESMKGRFDHIGSRIDETLKKDEAGALFIREDHRVQFPGDVQVFYVAPPALDALKRWINDQARSFAERMSRPQQPEEESS